VLILSLEDRPPKKEVSTTTAGKERYASSTYILYISGRARSIHNTGFTHNPFFPKSNIVTRHIRSITVAISVAVTVAVTIAVSVTNRTHHGPSCRTKREG
jgi:hypothetical protein